MKTLHATALGSRSADYNRTYYHLTVSPDVSVKDDILRPGFWAHHAQNLQVNDLIDIVSADGGLDMQVRVTGKGIGMVQMRVLRLWQREEQAQKPEETDIEVPAGYKVNFAPKTLWRVMTEEPAMEISRNHKSKNEATSAAIIHAAKAAGLAA